MPVSSFFRAFKFIILKFDFFSNEKSLSIALMLIFVAIVKFILTLFTIGARIPAGLFMPSIVIGACIGRAIGILMSSLER